MTCVRFDTILTQTIYKLKLLCQRVLHFQLMCRVYNYDAM